MVLCILDGWGERAERRHNAIAAARTPVFDRLMAECPHARLDASETFVGLPSGQMGNSEVGHMNIGAGRIVMQDLPRIDNAVRSGALDRNPRLQAFTDRLKDTGGTAHIMGLLSDGGVHAHQDHMAALARRLRRLGIPVAVHGFLDGRDTAPRAGRGFVAKFIADAPGTPIATLCGRFWAMDRDNHWDRVRKAYGLLVDGAGAAADDPVAAVEASYKNDIGDEFVEPVRIGDYAGMHAGDGILMANFRADRTREILSALADPGFGGFERGRVVDFAARLGMVEYSSAHDGWLETLFPPEELSDVLGETVAKAGLRQLRIAETEKYAHITFFLNGGREAVFDGEDRILIPSPDVRTYDLKPEMSAPKVTDELVSAVGSETYGLIVVNFANADMVGHTGIFDAAVRAVEAVDACLGRLTDAVEAAGGRMLVTADHGNADMMVDPRTGGPHTAHTLSRVPLLLVGAAPGEVDGLEDGRLADVAPTLLDLMALAQPATMTGHSLLRQRAERHVAE